MHVVQIMLVEAEDALDALGTVSAHLSEGEPTWSDWHNAFGQGSFAGRWKGEYFGADNTLDVLCYGDDVALAEKAIAQALEYRTQEIANLRSRISEKGVDMMNVEYDPYETSPISERSMALYYNYKLSQLLNDNWTSDSAIFDLVNWDTNLAGFRERVSKNPERQYLVVVDFHH